MDATGKTKVFHGLYLISDGGYHRWPCFAFPIKSGTTRECFHEMVQGMLELVRKDIECVFGILKKRFAILKAFNRNGKGSQLLTMCLSHVVSYTTFFWRLMDSLMLTFQMFRYGLRSKLKIDPRGDGMWMINSSGE
jgi:hypothetical protein